MRRADAQQSLKDLQRLAVRRDRLSAALEQAQFELERHERQLRDEGVPDGAIRKALGEPPKPRPRLVKAKFPPRQAPPPTMNGDGFWRGD